MDFDKTPDKFPYPATLSIKFGEALRDLNPILSTSLSSRTPFPNRKDRVLDRFEEESLTYRETNPKSEFYRIEQIGGQEVMRYARAVLLKPDCAECHNRPEFGFDGQWRPGDFRGARQVSMPVPNLTPIIDKATSTAIVLAIISSGLGGLLVWPIVARQHVTLRRTENLAAQLDLKNKALEEAGRAKGRFLAGISHDLKTPLNSIVGFAQMIRDGITGTAPNDQAKNYGGYIHESGTNLGRLIDQLLDISRIDSGLRDLDEEAIYLASFITDLRPMLENTLKSTGKNLTTDLAGDALILRADKRALMRIIDNLVENAAKYSDGSIVTIEFVAGDSGEIILQVSDDGKGIDPQGRSEITKFGVRAQETSGLASGYGIGLWSVETLAALHDATVEIDTSPKLGGCRVSVKFPRTRHVIR